MDDISQFYKVWGKITQALRTIQLVPEIQGKPDATTLIVNQGSIVFDKVSFNYKGTQYLFKDKSLIIESGQKIGLVGYSGGGKSTFINLILRLYDITEGAILIDGQNIQDVTQNSLHNALSVIPQDASLFNRSIIDNIRYGRINATDEEVIEAAKKAYAHDFIMKLAEGYNTCAGERGTKLSGGQRQRIAIARAILKDAHILIFDEITSQLDFLTENFIQNSLWNLMQDKTTLVIAHRLATLLNMDRILVFDHGKIIEDGTHKDLLLKNGFYRRLWDAQVGGFLPTCSEPFSSPPPKPDDPTPKNGSPLFPVGGVAFALSKDKK